MRRVVTFLSATSPRRTLTKTFHGNGTVEPYPLVSKFTSITGGFETLDDWYALLTEAAKTGVCLLKGRLDRELANESRAGHTNPLTPTSELIIDYDADDGFDSRDSFLAALDPALENVSYIFQHSASAGIRSKPGLRGHYFILLNDPVPPDTIKQWCIKLNLAVPGLKSRLRLNADGITLRYPLDITVNQNDKLIYIAGPKFIDREPPNIQRWELVKKPEETFALYPNIAKERNRADTFKLISTLREEQGLPKRKFKSTQLVDHQLLENVDECAVTEEREEGDFTRINLNGGDSWAYWYWTNNPQYLYSFKDTEICYKLEELAPDYYHRVNRKLVQALVPFVFRCPERDAYYSGIYNDNDKKILSLLPVKSKERLGDFMQQFGQRRPKIIQDWDLVFDPHTTDEIRPETQWANLYKAPTYAEQKHAVTRIPPTIARIVAHICVDRPTLDHFLNWLAFIVQKRDRTGTAWVFQGTYGTGKGVFFHEVIRPILGEKYTQIIEQKDLEDKFNGYLENKFVVFLDETNLGHKKDVDKLLDKCKIIITEKSLPIRRMQQAVTNVRNYINLIIASNELVPIQVRNGDRRYNIAPRQEKRLELGDDFTRILSELNDFAAYLNNYQVDEEKARAPLINEARNILIEMSKTSSDQFFDALKQGNLEYFTDFLHSGNEFIPGFQKFEALVKKWYDANGEPVPTSNHELLDAYTYTSGKKELGLISFGWLCGKHQINFERKRRAGPPERIIDLRFEPVDWELTPRVSDHNNVVQLRGKP